MFQIRPAKPTTLPTPPQPTNATSETTEINSTSEPNNTTSNVKETSKPKIKKRKKSQKKNSTSKNASVNKIPNTKINSGTKKTKKPFYDHAPSRTSHSSTSSTSTSSTKHGEGPFINHLPAVEEAYQGLASSYELTMVEQFKFVLGDLLKKGAHSKFREVVGDVNLLRLLRECKYDTEIGKDIFNKHVLCRQKYGMNIARERITHQFNTHLMKVRILEKQKDNSDGYHLDNLQDGRSLLNESLPGNKPNTSIDTVTNIAISNFFMKWNQNDLIYGSEITEWVDQQHNSGYTKRGKIFKKRRKRKKESRSKCS